MPAVPWCDDCSKFWNPPELAGGSRCPSCDQVLATAPGTAVASGPGGGPSNGGPRAAHGPAVATGPSTGGSPSAGAGAGAGAETAIASGGSPEAKAEDGAVATAKRAPWHFKLLVVGVAAYMVYRVIWFIEWLPKHV